MSDEDLRAEIERLRRENAELKRKPSRVSIKVSEKGGLSVYGMGRFPVTLYKEQWLRLLDMADEIRLYLFECGTIRLPRYVINAGDALNEERVDNPTPWYLITHPRGNVVIDGIRSIPEVEVLKKVGNVKLLAISFKSRFLSITNNPSIDPT